MDTNKMLDLKALAEAAGSDEWYAAGDLRYCDDKTGETHGLHHDDGRFIAAASPAAILALLAEIERLKAENEKLRQSPLKQALDAIAVSAANRLASEAKGCIEKGLVETIDNLKVELGDLVAAVSDLGGKHDEPGWVALWKARDKARAVLEVARD